MTVDTRVTSGSRSLIPRRDATITQLPAAQLYDLLGWYYLNNGLYDDLTRAMYDKSIWTEGMKALRNPAFRVVEFYAAKLWAGQLPKALAIETENEDIIEAIEQVWEWSNWTQRKQVAARWFAMYGDMFIKVVQKNGADGEPVSVYMQLLEPHRVTEFDTDERGFLTYCRIDTPMLMRIDDVAEMYTHTEVWDKAENSLRIWKRKGDAISEVEKLGKPDTTMAITDFGIDFVPIAHGKFRDIGDKRGISAYTHALDKIDEVNRQATRLHQMLFRYQKVTEVLEGDGTDASGRPLPAPVVKGRIGQYDDDDRIKVGDDRMVRLPSGWRWKQTVPQLDYKAALDVVDAQMTELEKDLPEFAYYRLREMQDLSGKAVRLLLSDAADRVVEARANGEAVIVHANAMALTMGINAGLFEKSLGNYVDGDFKHGFVEREVFPLSMEERADAVKAIVETGVPLTIALKLDGWSTKEIEAVIAEQQAEREREMKYSDETQGEKLEQQITL